MDIPAITPTLTLLDHRRIHIEVSSKCTLKCPRCPRTELRPEALNREISLLEFQRAFTADLLSEIEEITFCGDIGDPIYAKDFLDIVEYIKRSRFTTRLVIVTNGSYKDPSWWTDLGELLNNHDTVTFSVDGWDQESNERYRVNSNFDSIIRGARALRAASNCIMNWSAIYFSFNEREMQHIQDLAQELGFDTFHRVHSTKFDGAYLLNGTDPLKPSDQYVQNAGKYVVDRHSLGTRGVTLPLHRWDSRERHPWARCMNGDKEMFITVDGLAFPCPWFNSGYMYNDFVEKHRDQISIKTRTLKEILQDPLWEELYTRFEVAPLDICKLKCRDAQ
jgi:MoaA/NifB/PqqE/SkfB family radical SAM enzyme